MGDLTSTIKAVQKSVGVTADGVAGPLTWGAIAERVGVESAAKPASPMPATTGAGASLDERSEGNIAGLNPVVQPLARRFLHAVWEDGINARIISGYRTDAEQARLYAKYKAGGPVAAPPGHSNHNFGLAWDIGIFDGDGHYLESSRLYQQAGSIGKDLGLIWGGDWTNGDEPHFEFRPEWAKDLTESAALAAYRERKLEGKAIA